MEQSLDLIRLKIQYLEVLSKGKARPDKRGGCGSVYEAKDNLADIEAVKDSINRDLSLDVDAIRKARKANQRIEE